MVFTADYIEKCFDRFNRELFSSSLPAPRFALSRSRGQMGRMQCDARRTPQGVTRTFTLACSVMFDFTEEQAQNVVIHEMIHYYIIYNGLRDSSPHGLIFRTIMERINKSTGRNITVSVRDQSVNYSDYARSGLRLHIIFTVKLKTGESGYAVVGKSHIADYLYKLRNSSIVKSWKIYSSRSSDFVPEVHVRSFKIFRMNDNMLRLLAGADEMVVCRDDRLYFKDTPK